jgi:hypothetical protein
MASASERLIGATLRTTIRSNYSLSAAASASWKRPVRRTLPEGTPEEVRARFGDLGAGGGYVAAPSHNLQPDVPTANVLALYDEARECRY